MKGTNKSILAWSLWMIGGIVLTSAGLTSLNSNSRLATDQNPFAIQRSAYGRLLARLTESTIDRIWHIGIEESTPHDNGDHSNCSHGDLDDEEFVFTVEDSENDHDDHQASAEVAHDNNDHAAHDHSDHSEHDHSSVATVNEPVIEQMKGWFSDIKSAKYTRTNPYSLSEQHRLVVAKDIEEMLLRSYKMDPAHYGVYNSYHLFLTIHAFGGTEKSRAHAEVIANATIAEVFRETEDPEPWLTAASAYSYLYQFRIEDYLVAGKPVPIEILKEFRAKIGHCLQQFKELQQAAEESGSWANLSPDRQYEISDRARFALRTFEPFDVMIARAERRKLGVGKMEQQVAEMLDSIEDL
tara:strand:- start:406 stop:1467 length:1062 start_codon:yes stop_codon:yes gene_type:complete